MITFSETDLTEVRSLASQVRRVQRAHRAGITPTFGELENMFESAGTVERLLEAKAPAVAVATCDVTDCRGVASRKLTSGRKLCASCYTTFTNLAGVGDLL